MIDASDLPICFATLPKHNSRSHSSRMSGAHEEIFQNFLLHFETAVDTDLGRHFPDPLNGEQVFDHELSSLYTPLASDDSFLSIHVMEFKTSLLEAAEELHIHRDAEMRFEEQINKFVMEKQELEWEKESLQRQIHTLVHQHNESLAAQQKQFQARIAEIEGEKGKHQLSAELTDRENVRLKEAVKMLQLFKCSLQKKLSELEQKLQLQAQARDSHLSQLGEVERRFGALSRQCAAIKQAHEKLMQNVEEAMRLNKKLTIVNELQEATINSLKQDVDKANSEVIKSKVSSASKSEEDIPLHIIKEQMLLLSLRLNMETDMNKQLTKENAAVMAEKQELMRALQQACQLLQAQTEALSRAERELSVQREERQGSAQTQRVHVQSGPVGSDFPGPSTASISTPPAGIAPRRPSPPDHAAEHTPPEPRSEGNEQSKISARSSETRRLQLPQKRKAEPEDHEVYTSTEQHSNWASLWEE